MSEVSSEAVEALAEQFEFYLVDTVDQPGTFAAKVTVEQIEGLARLALAAHQPARVVPSAEEVARTWWRGMYGVDAPATFEAGESGTLSAYNASLWEDFLHAAERVLALYASQPTVAQVLEPVQALVDGRSDIGQPFRPPNMTTRVIHRGDVAAALERARTVARGETKGGE